MPPPPPGIAGASFFSSGISRDERLGGEQQRRDGRGVLQRRAHDLRGVDDAGLDQILVVVGERVEALSESFISRTRCTTMEPSWPALVAIHRIGSSIARLTMLTPIC